MTIDVINAVLEKHFLSIDKIILSRQDPITGLLPASTAVNAHGDYTDAWVRDNVYSILSVWGLSLAYKKHLPNHHRSYLLSQSVVKLMRGLLSSMMRQADKVEAFKTTLNPIDALHAKYGTLTGLAVVGDDEWGHLQLDATSLYLLMLAQMIASGLHLIYTMDEVDFIQNLVHYVSHTYYTPDYGIWERGNKINHGTTEINCSSVGMAKAALEVMDGFNLFGEGTGQEAIIHIVPSDVTHSRFTLHSLLPRESNSKETDAALLSIIGYPAYAIEDENLVKLTRQKIIKKLVGNYGAKRFLLDGHQSSIENASRLHYEPSELRTFEHIESEWPLFFTYLLLDALMREDDESVQHWQKKLEPLFVQEEGEKLLPELFFVPLEHIDDEKSNPGSQTRIPNENIPLVWAQSLYMLCEMHLDGVLDVGDIDPLSRRKRVGYQHTTEPMVCLLAEDEGVQRSLKDFGIVSQTLQELTPLKVLHASELAKVHTFLGKNEKLSLSGRPLSVLRTIATSRLHVINKEKILFLPYYFNPKGFYVSYDNKLLVEHFRASLQLLSQYWDQSGSPVIPFLVRKDMLIEGKEDVVLELLHDLQNNKNNTINIVTADLDSLLTRVDVESINTTQHFTFLDLELPYEEECICYSLEDKKIAAPLSSQEIQGLENEENSFLDNILINSSNRRKKAYALSILWQREGSDYEISTIKGSFSLSFIAEKLYRAASICHDWSVVRFVANLSKKYDERLEDVLLELIIRQKRLAVGRAYSEEATFSKPLKNQGILHTIATFCGDNDAEWVLIQEVILHLGHLIKIEPELFDNIITIRAWYIIQLLVGQISREENLAIGDAYERLLCLAPHEIYERIRQILQSYSTQTKQLLHQENMRVSGVPTLDAIKIDRSFTNSLDVACWANWRYDIGMIGAHSSSFYKDTWHLLQQCKGLVIGEKYSIHSRIGSELTLDATAGERNFELRVDALLQGINAPDYRQLNIEAIQSMARLFRQSPQLHLQSDLILDVLIGHAVRIAWSKEMGYENYDEQKERAWIFIYKLSPQEVDKAFVEAFIHLLQLEEKQL